MRTIRIVMIFLLVRGIGYLTFAVGQLPPSPPTIVVIPADKSEHKPCRNLQTSTPSDEDMHAFTQILLMSHVNPDIILAVSHDPMLKSYGGAMSFRCLIRNHEPYDAYENWIIYDPELIQGDAARDFVFAHEIAHHAIEDTSSARPPSKDVELRADSYATKYLLQAGWNKARIMHALDLLHLPQLFEPSYPTLEERKAVVEIASGPEPPPAPSHLVAFVISDTPSKSHWNELLNLQYMGTIYFLVPGTSEFVCSVITPDARTPSVHHFAFFNNCDRNARASFTLEPTRLGYWIEQQEVPCPDYAVNCLHVLESAEGQLQFWNQDLAADLAGWDKEVGKQSSFNFEAVEQSDGLVLIRNIEGYIFVDPKTSKLQNGGNREQASEFKVLFE